MLPRGSWLQELVMTVSMIGFYLWLPLSRVVAAKTDRGCLGYSLLFMVVFK